MSTLYTPKQALERWKAHPDDHMRGLIHEWIVRNSGFKHGSNKVTNIGGPSNSKRTLNLGLGIEEFRELLVAGGGYVEDRVRVWANHILPGVAIGGGDVQVAPSVASAAPATSSTSSSLLPSTTAVPAVTPSGTQAPASAAPAPTVAQPSADPAMDAGHLRKLQSEFAALQAALQQSPAALFIEMFWQLNPMKSRTQASVLGTFNGQQVMVRGTSTFTGTPDQPQDITIELSPEQEKQARDYIAAIQSQITQLEANLNPRAGGAAAAGDAAPDAPTPPPPPPPPEMPSVPQAGQIPGATVARPTLSATQGAVGASDIGVIRRKYAAMGEKWIKKVEKLARTGRLRKVNEAMLSALKAFKSSYEFTLKRRPDSDVEYHVKTYIKLTADTQRIMGVPAEQTFDKLAGAGQSAMTSFPSSQVGAVVALNDLIPVGGMTLENLQRIAQGQPMIQTGPMAAGTAPPGSIPGFQPELSGAIKQQASREYRDILHPTVGTERLGGRESSTMQERYGSMPLPRHLRQSDGGVYRLSGK